MRTSIFKALSCLVVALIIGGEAYSLADDTKLTKTVTRKFKVNQNVNIDIANKYGQVIVNTWSKDSVVVNIQVSAFGRNDKEAGKSMDRVDFDFNNVSNFLTINTVFDRSSGSFKELFNSIGDYSKSLLSKNKLQVDYEIFIPAKAALDLENKFGDVYINKHSGRLKIVMSHGDLRSNDLTGSAQIEIGFGKGYFKNLQDADLTSRASELEIGQTANLSLTSSSSEVSIKEAFSVKLDSRNDDIRINKIQVLQGKGVFTDLNLGEIETLLDLDLSYGSMMTGVILSKFSKIKVDGKSTDINLYISDRSSFRGTLIAKNEDLSLDRTFSKFLNSEHIDRKGTSVVTGSYGKNGNPTSEVIVDAHGGSLTVRLVEETLSTLKD
ncbi:MAG: hypothetical protein RJQ09_03030 [Cyclobacteriaceae bacterium]